MRRGTKRQARLGTRHNTESMEHESLRVYEKHGVRVHAVARAPRLVIADFLRCRLSGTGQLAQPTTMSCD